MSQLAHRLSLPFYGVLASLLVSACGGGDGSPPPQPNQSSGWAVDGYLQAAAVLCDSDGNGLPSVGEDSATTTSGGLFSFAEGCRAGLVVTGGTNHDTGLRFTGTLKGTVGSKVVTPLTTLLVGGLAQDQLNATLGLPADTDVAHTDPAATQDGTLVNAALMKKTLAVQQLIQKSSEMLNGLSANPDSAALPAIYTEVAAAFAQYLKDGAKLNLNSTTLDVAVVGDLVKAAALRVGDAPTLSSALRKAVKAVNADALAGVTAGGLQVQAEAILKAGSNAQNVSEVTKAQQSDTQITTYVSDNKAALAGTPSAESVTGMADALTKQVTDSQDGGTVTPPPTGNGTLLVSFDEATPAFSDMGAYAGALPSVEAGPAGGSGNALKILKPVAPETFGGVYFTVARIPFTNDRKKITARVNASRAGAVIKFKVEVPGGASVEVAGTATGAANTWSTVTWDFSAVDPTLAYTVIAITPDAELATSGRSYYIDNITLAPAGPVTPPPPTSGVLLSFDEATPAFSDMGAFGGALPSVEAGPAGGSGNALKILKPVAPETFGGVYFTVARIPFTNDRKTITARVNASRAGAVIKFKVEVPGGASVEVAGTATGAANTWSTVTWDFSAANTALAYTVMAITPDAELATSGQSYFIDSITLAPAGTVITPPPATGSVLLSFDEATPAFTDMGAFGGALPSVEAGPAGGSGNALKILKPVAPDTWGGVYFNVTRIPFTNDRKKITARVYATRAGAIVRFKVEVPGGASVEVAGTATGAANTWSTVNWDFSAVDIAGAFTIMAITPDRDLATSGQSYYIDTITLAPAGPVVPPPPAGNIKLLSFDETTPAFSEMGAYGGALPSVEAGPAGGSGNALKILKPVADVTWGGVYFNVATIPFASDRKTITARVHSSRAAAVISFKVEIPGGSSVEVLGTPTGAANTWSTVTWNFAGVDPTRPYRIMAITPDAAVVASGQTYFIDDITLKASEPVAPKTIATLDEPGASLTGFEGAYDSTLVNDPTGGSNKVGRIVKPDSNVANYAGATVVTVANGGLTPIPFTDTAKTMTVRVWSPDANIPVRLKVEDITDKTKSVETEALTTTVGWQTLTFNFANPSVGTPALNLATLYNKVTIFFNFGTPGTGKTYFFDTITFVTGTGTNLVLASFDEIPTVALPRPPVLTGFGGAEDSTVVSTSGGLPAGGTGKGAKVIKAPGEVWAGTSVQAKPNDGVPTIPFANGATKMTVRVYTTYPPGIRVRLKVENASNPAVNSEVDAFTTTTNAWETLTFDFGPASLHFVPNGPGPNGYQTNPNLPGYLPTAQLDPSQIYNKVNIFFDYGLGDGGYGPMPDTRTYYFDDVRFIGP